MIEAVLAQAKEWVNDKTVPETLNDKIIAVLGTILLCVLLAILFGDGAPRYSSYPTVGDGWLKPWLKWSVADRWRLDQLTTDGYETYSKKSIPWRVNFMGLGFLVMPPKYLRDLRTIDRGRLSSAAALSDALNMEASVGTVHLDNNMEIEVVSKHLNGHLAKAVPILNEEADWAFHQELGSDTDWQETDILDLSAKFAHFVSNRVLVGPELSRREDYRAATETLTIFNLIFSSLWNFLYLGPFRKPAYWLTSTPLRLQIRHIVNKYFVPIIKERMARKEEEKPLDTIQLMVDMPPASPQEVDPFRHGLRMVHLHLASTASTTGLLHTALWQLLQAPDCIQPIRDEIGDVRERFGWGNNDMLNHLHLLDSFLRETLRVHPPSALISLRKVVGEPLTLHDGLQLQPGSRIVFPAQSVHFDAQNYQDPMKFNGFRFAGSAPCRCGSAQTTENGRAKADAVDDKFLAFGYGRQACPGRFFSIKVVKLIMARLIWDYEMKWADGAPPSPRDWSMEGFFVPRKNIKILIRNRGI